MGSFLLQMQVQGKWLFDMKIIFMLFFKVKSGEGLNDRNQLVRFQGSLHNNGAFKVNVTLVLEMIYF